MPRGWMEPEGGQSEVLASCPLWFPSLQYSRRLDVNPLFRDEETDAEKWFTLGDKHNSDPPKEVPILTSVSCLRSPGEGN